jgi:hypothetical protein
MISALARWNGDHAMTKDTTKEAVVAAEVFLFDDWFDAIEDGVRARVRGFIETMLEEELSDALSRPRYGRRKPGEDAAAPSVVGVRHGHRERTLTGTFSVRAASRKARCGMSLAGPMAAMPDRRPGAAPLQALQPFHRRRLADLVTSSRSPTAHLAPLHRVDHAIAQILRIWLRHLPLASAQPTG